MEYTQEELQEMISGTQGVVVSSEKVYGGTRPLEIVYTLPDGCIVKESFTYLHAADSDSWAACSRNLTRTENA